MRGLHPIVSAVVAALTAAGTEILQAKYGLPWVYMALALPAAPTPLAQWAQYLSVFGVSFILYLVNFLWLPDHRNVMWIRWLAPMVGAAIAAFAWIGGMTIAHLTEVQPLSFTGIIVQPDGVGNSDAKRFASRHRAAVLQSLTRRALAAETETDIVIWPESAWSDINWPDRIATVLSDRSSPGEDTASGTSAGSIHRADLGSDPLGEYYNRLAAEHSTALLLGARVSTSRGALYNSACLFAPSGRLTRHDKLVLVPLMEKLPFVLDSSWFRAQVLPMFGATVPLQPGDRYRVLTFTNRRGHAIRMGISICYEMYFPWLPQYRRSSEVDAIVHLASERWAEGDRRLSKYENYVCQYRAIETRRWQLLCTTMGNSAVFDPRGAIRASLHGTPGWLRATGSSEPCE
jgi:apolipoprotein N-acyltransferase